MKRLKRALTGVLVCGALACPAAADDPPPFPDFTFKRVKAPKPGAAPRITVQIEEERATTVAAPNLPNQQPAAGSTARASASDYDWFWDEISPTLASSRPGRLDAALRHMQNGSPVPSPRLDRLMGVLNDHASDILIATIGTQVSPALALSVISVESNGNATAVSPKGATGLMQLMPATAERFGVTDSNDPKQNIKGGVAYLDWLMGEFDNDPILVLAAYNAGEGSVRRYEGVPPFAETRAYVPKVLSAWKVARGLCKTPPELVSDGCAFNLQGG
ncbi:MAG: lytic transglycosylase domain-containing protein [Pseudomonadota bacterium]